PYLKSVEAAARDHNAIMRTGTTPSESEKRERADRKLKKFKSLKPTAVNLAETPVVETSYLREGQTSPLVMSRAAHAVDLADWAASNQTLIDSRLAQNGAILFRGFHVAAAAEFERFARTLCRELLQDN